MTVSKIQSTRDYRSFNQSSENRPRDLRKHKKLMESMKLYGFLKCYPLVVHRDSTGLTIKDGQHRLAIAELLGLIVYYIEEDVDFDVAMVNSAAKAWQIRDYAEKFSINGNKNYQDGLEFADRHHLPVGTAFALLAGNTSFGNIRESFVDGSFKIKDREWADDVAILYGSLTQMQSAIKNARFIEACMAVCRVDGFDTRRMLSCAARCREKLVPYSTREAYLDMLEEVYNYGRQQAVGLKAAATMAMRQRNVGQSANGKQKK